MGTMELAKYQHIHPEWAVLRMGGATHECQESNLVLAGFGDQLPIRWLAHPKRETARQGLCPGSGVRTG